jgi:hypothetical protein
LSIDVRFSVINQPSHTGTLRKNCCQRIKQKNDYLVTADMSNRFSQFRTQVVHNKWLSLNTLFLVAALVLAIVALVYAMHNKQELDGRNGPTTTVTARSNFGNANSNSNNYSNYSGSNSNNIANQRTTDNGYNFWGPMNKVLDGNDAGNSLYGGAAQSQCPPIAMAEPYHPTMSASSGAPKMVSSASAYASAYPDETAAQSLAGKTTYSCAPDVAGASGCDYAINPDNLMPGSWREGVGCSDGTDPNSQWAKYHPTREKYYRYITAAGSARLGVITRSPMRKILGVQNFLRSSTSTPITAGEITMSNDSSQRQEAIFRSIGSYPVAGSDSC